MAASAASGSIGPVDEVVRAQFTTRRASLIGQGGREVGWARSRATEITSPGNRGQRSRPSCPSAPMTRYLVGMEEDSACGLAIAPSRKRLSDHFLIGDVSLVATTVVCSCFKSTLVVVPPISMSSDPSSFSVRFDFSSRPLVALK